MGYEFQVDSKGVDWRHRVGHFGTPQDARVALDTFIHKLPCPELKKILLA